MLLLASIPFFSTEFECIVSVGLCYWWWGSSMDKGASHFVENVRGLLVYWNCKEHVFQVSLQSVMNEKTIQKKLLH